MRSKNKVAGAGTTGSSASPCAACKLLRRRCAEDCLFAPYFPPDQPHKFASVHKVFGASNVNKLLQELPVNYRSDAVSSMVYEANARVRDPVYGCAGAISSLQQQVDVLQAQLAMAQAEIIRLRMQHAGYLAHLRLTPARGGGGGGGGSSATSSPKMTEVNDKPVFNLETEMDQTSMYEPMWYS
ncbi:LOB domain-containing protein 4-like [Dioscorea cayenensis subsp. rotundata]|uniref:LOB domain-containing protein 4-like n=1 Tax=Dioscorea cayennensis subsp. rotundata TaxID=55577 RepID=A0AB40BX29_DIOCR|nr:LOB domain-containing protein 4-like [Dioscorea cayenensis subsp. rotundata]